MTIAQNRWQFDEVETRRLVALYVTPDIVSQREDFLRALTYSNRIIDSIVPFVTGRNGIVRAEAEAWAQELRQAGEQGKYFFSLNRYLFLARRR